MLCSLVDVVILVVGYACGGGGRLPRKPVVARGVV